MKKIYDALLKVFINLQLVRKNISATSIEHSIIFTPQQLEAFFKLVLCNNNQMSPMLAEKDQEKQHVNKKRKFTSSANDA